MLLIELVEKYGGSATTLNDKIANALPHIFDFTFPMYDPSYLTVLETKIVRHFLNYFTCYDDEDEWKAALETQLNEDMLLFNQRYASTLVQINPLYTHFLETVRSSGGTQTANDSTSTTISGSETINESGNRNSSESHGETVQDETKDSATLTSNNQKTNRRQSENIKRESDTPMGDIDQIDNYLSRAEKNNNVEDVAEVDNGSQGTSSISEGKNVRTGQSHNGEESQRATSKTNGQTQTVTGNNSVTTTEQYLDTVKGNSGISQAELIAKWRETFIDIDKEIIKSLKTLFILCF